MNASQADDLIAAVKAQTAAQLEQAAAINRLAESNQALVNVLISYAEEPEEEVNTLSVYLNGQPQESTLNQIKESVKEAAKEGYLLASIGTNSGRR